jgi:hypothetical protein
MSAETPSISDTLGAMEPGDLLRLADDLQELGEDPRFRKLVDLVDVQRQKVEAQAQKRALPHPTTLAGGVDALIREQTLAAYQSGTYAGLAQWQGIVATVNKTAERVREALGEDDEE